jgi:putative SbcD/Mre11-related phosphoesterase
MQKLLFSRAGACEDYEFIGKALFLPKEKILAIGDLHLGYEFMLREAGALLPETQIKDTINELKEIFEILEKRKVKLNKLIFLGDVKHYFAYKKQEKNIFLEIVRIVEKYVPEKNIVFIKGNHEKMDIGEKKFVFYHIEKDIAFIHGDKIFPEVMDKKIKKIVMAHLHPAVKISDDQGVRAEKYKCFLMGKYKSKEFFVLPSFFPLIEGSSVNEYISEHACIIPPKNLKSFRVFVVGEKNSIYDFGKLKGLNGGE